jgi:hypothetical protein
MQRKSDPRSAAEKFNKILSKNQERINEMIRQYVDQSFIQSDEGDPKKRKQNVIDMIETEFKKMFGSDVTVIPMGGNNNLNLSIQYKGEEFVIQIGAEREPSQTAVSRLNSPTSKPWLAEVYGEHTLESGSETLAMMAAASTKPQGFMRMVEKLPTSLEHEVEKRKQEDKKEKKVMVGTTREIEFAKGIGMQLSTIFSTMSADNIVWTDCKPGNLLLRENDDGSHRVVIADAKAILPVDQMPRTKSGQIVFDALLTEDFISREGSKRLENPDYHKPEAFKALMEKEYSYQLAVTLYYAATGETILSRDPKTFSYNADMFKTIAGERLKFIIEQLSKPNPDERMSHLAAAQLLAVINNDEQYKRVLDKVQNPSPPASPAMAHGTASIHMALAAREGKANPRGEARVMLERRSSQMINPAPRKEKQNEEAKLTSKTESPKVSTPSPKGVRFSEPVDAKPEPQTQTRGFK